MKEAGDYMNIKINKIISIICIFSLIGLAIGAFGVFNIRNVVIQTYIDMGLGDQINGGMFFSEIGIFVVGLIVMCIIYKIFSKNIHKNIVLLITILLNWTYKYYLLCLCLAVSNLYTGKFLFDAYGM